MYFEIDKEPTREEFFLLKPALTDLVVARDGALRYEMIR